MTVANYKQTDLAAVIGKSRPTVSAWLDGRRRPTIDDVAACAEILNVSTDFLLGVVSVEELDRRRLHGIDCNLDAVSANLEAQRKKQ